MASAEAWIVNLLGAASYAVGAYVAVMYVLPLVGGFLGDVIKYRAAVKSFVKLLSILIYVTAAAGVVSKISAIGEQATGYITVVSPALEVINGLFFPTLKLLVIGVGILLVAERVRLK